MGLQDNEGNTKKEEEEEEELEITWNIGMVYLLVIKMCIHYVKFKFITYNLCVYSTGLNESKETSEDKGKISLLTTFSCFLL